MNPLRVAGWAVSLLCDWLAPVQKPWPDSEKPLIDAPPLLMGQEFGLVTDAVTGDPLPGGFRWGCTDHESSVPAGSASEAGAEPKAEGPTPGRAHTPGVGHPSSPESLVEVDGVVPSFAGGSGHPKLLRASALQLEEWSHHIACPAAIYCGSLARQLREMATRFDNQ